MSEESPENYNSGDIVWVKLGSSWWPGEVKDIEELPNEILDFKKPPLVIVKFFDEDSYEYVRSWANIYPYNCEKKNDFIKKGMVAFRAKVPHMEKFPKDVLTSEEKVGGNPNILSEPAFLPERKRNYVAEVFGTPSPKVKVNKDKKGRPSSTKKASQKDTGHITHRRFLGVDDYQAFICIQYPGKDRVPGDREDEEVLRINREPEQDYNCQVCSFTTKRLEVMVLHTKSHIHGVYVSSSRKSKVPMMRRKKDKTRRSRPTDIIESESDTSDSEPIREKKRKPRSQGPKKAKMKKTEEKIEPAPKTDICSELLAVWDDSDEDEEEENVSLNKTMTTESEDLNQSTSVDPNDTRNETLKEISGEILDDVNDVPNKTNETVKDKAEELNQVDHSVELKDTAKELNQSEVMDQSAHESVNKSSEEHGDNPTEKLNQSEVQSQSINKAGKVPSKPDADDLTPKKTTDEKETDAKANMRDIQEEIKSCFDFDEDEEEDHAIISKAAAGRKIPRVIPLAERKKSKEIIEDINRDIVLKESASFNKNDEAAHSEEADAAFKELMEITAVPELPEVQNALKCEQNFHNIKTIKFPDKVELAESHPKVAKLERKDSSEVATKLTNPKKRFVKSFEDFELMQNEIRRKEEQTELPKSKKSVSVEEKIDESSCDPTSSLSDDLDIECNISMLKSKIMSQIIEEAKINDESKNKIMSKIQEPRQLKKYQMDTEANTPTIQERSTGSKVEVKTEKVSHRTPRSKILESYRNDTNKHKLEEEHKIEEQQKEDSKNSIATNENEETAHDRLKEALSRTDVVPPKKNKWSRRGSHPKKDRNLFLLQDITLEETLAKDLVKDEKESVTADTRSVLEASDALNSTPSDSVLEATTAVSTNNAASLATGKEVEEKKVEEKKGEEKKVEEKKVEEKKGEETTVEEKKVETNSDENEPLLKNKQTEDVSKQSGPDDVKSNIENHNDKSVEESSKYIDEVSKEEEKTPLREETASELVEADDSSKAQELITLQSKVDEIEKFLSKDQETDGMPSKEESVGKSIEENEQTPVMEVQKDELQKGELQESCKPTREEPHENVPPLDSPPTIQSPQKESITVEKDVDAINNTFLSEETCVAPLEETSGGDSNKLIPTVEQDSTPKPEESPLLSPTTNAVPPPEVEAEVLNKSPCVPPKKSKKRKMSESKIILPSSPPSDTPKDQSLEDFVPLEKRKKEIALNDEEPETLKTPLVDSYNATQEGIQEDKQNNEVTNNDGEVKEPGIEPCTPDKDSKTVCGLEKKEPLVMDHSKEVEIQCASSSVESFKFSIQTNLSNLTSREEMSALALATLSEIPPDTEKDSTPNEEKTPQPSENNLTVPIPVPVEPELVPIEGNLTVVSEKDLADGQVEITSNQVISPKKPVTLSNFSMDFSDSASDSNSTNDTLSDISIKATSKRTEFISKGTEFTSKAMTKQIKRMDKKKENAYERFELLNILEGNSDYDKKPREYVQHPRKSTNTTTMEEICDFEEHIPSQIVCAKTLKEGKMDFDHDFKEKEKHHKQPERSTASKLLERLTESKGRASVAKALEREMKVVEHVGKVLPKTRNTKYVVKTKTAANISKPIMLPEQIKPPGETSRSKKLLDDIEDVEAFVIHKDPKKMNFDEEESAKSKSLMAKSAGKAKILQQTIITPAGEIIQPIVNEVQTDDNIFDINSMPIVLSDEILTPESIENMPIVIGNEAKTPDFEKIVKKHPPARIIAKTPVTVTQATPNKTIIKHSKPPRILQSFSSKLVKNSPLLPSTTKPGKYIIVPQSSMSPAKFVAKKPPIVKRTSLPASMVSKVPNIAPEPSGNKIMIVTNPQGQQQRLLLTPAQQKILGYQNQRVTKTVVKGNVLQKSVLATKSVPLIEAGTSGVVSKSTSLLGQKLVIATSSNPHLMTTSHQVISNQTRTVKTVTKRLPVMNQKVFSNAAKPQKTILIKNQHGHTVRKIQGTDDELLDKQVAEQLEAIKASSGMKFSSQPKQSEALKTIPKTTIRRSYAKKVDTKPKPGPPPLAGIHQSPKPETVVGIAKKTEPVEPKPVPPLATDEVKTQADRPLNQLVIQDAVGNQTTITEGQILALPSETVDGQPQSYMLVTLDESGNLTPLNSEALMSLDPNLGLGGDLSNMVLQIDQGALTERAQPAVVKATEGSEHLKTVEMEPVATVPVPEPSVTTEVTDAIVEQKVVPISETPQPIIPSTNGDPGQQLIVTGDPIATQKFLESLTEGTTDLANILANADGNSILIQADGQQILINTNADNQMLLSVNNDNINASDSTEGGGNPIFATQPSKNQDILAAALADTDVFQQEQHTTQGKITSQLSPNNTLYPMNVGNVLETSLTLNSPIMTPLEVPSTNNKKIPDEEANILTQVPKNVDLPITITDPNISQTVANQQVASMIANELQTNLELGLPISESTISAVSTEMNSPSYVYSLPTLDDSVDITQKPFNSSMPLLNEDVEESITEAKDEGRTVGSEHSQKTENSQQQGEINSGSCFLEEEEGRFTLGREMCSSLSEPPPEMFDLPESNQNYIEKSDGNVPSSLQSTPDVSDNTSKDGDTTDMSLQAESSSEGSCEIPLQPQIVTKSLDLSKNLDSLKRSLEGPEGEEESKKCKFD